MKLLGKCLLIFLVAFGVNFAVEPVQADPHDQLVPLLVNLDGWKANKGTGMSMAAGDMKVITAQRSYTNGKKQVDVNVIVNSGPPPTNQMQDYSTETGDTRTKTEKIDGFWVSASFNKKKGAGQVSVVLANNQDTHALLSLNYRSMNEKETIEVAKKFKWKALAKVTGKML